MRGSTAEALSLATKIQDATAINSSANGPSLFSTFAHKVVVLGCPPKIWSDGSAWYRDALSYGTQWKRFPESPSTTCGLRLPQGPKMIDEELDGGKATCSRGRHPRMCLSPLQIFVYIYSDIPGKGGHVHLSRRYTTLTGISIDFTSCLQRRYDQTSCTKKAATILNGRRDWKHVCSTQKLRFRHVDQVFHRHAVF
jgi:hypothetical protein